MRFLIVFSLGAPQEFIFTLGGLWGTAACESKSGLLLSCDVAPTVVWRDRDDYEIFRKAISMSVCCKNQFLGLLLFATLVTQQITQTILRKPQFFAGTQVVIVIK